MNNDDVMEIQDEPLLPQDKLFGGVVIVVLLVCGVAMRSWLYQPPAVAPAGVPVVADASPEAVAENEWEIQQSADLAAQRDRLDGLDTLVVALAERVRALEAQIDPPAPKADEMDGYRPGGEEPARPKTKRERVKAIVFSAPNCPPCERLKSEWRTILPPLGWKLKGDDADIEFRDVSAAETNRRYPYTEIHVDGKRVEEIVGFCTAEFISKLILRHVNSLDTEA